MEVEPVSIPEQAEVTVMNLIEKKLLYINLNPQEIRDSALSREHFEKAMFDAINLRCASNQEKAMYIRIMKVVLDKAFPA